MNNIGKLLSSKESYLCSFSGGQDSSFLLFCLLHLKKKSLIYEYRLHYSHHFWQPSNFLSFWQLIRWASCHNLMVSINLLEKKDYNFSLITEDKARHWRYECLFRNNSLTNKKFYILLGHTGSDFIETYLTNIFRGSSSQGLKLKYKKIWQSSYAINSFPTIHAIMFIKKFKMLTNMTKYSLLSAPKKFNLRSRKLKLKASFTYNINLSSNIYNLHYSLRPLFTGHRQDISYLCKNLRLPIITDKTNNRLKYSRNKMRHLLIPLIRTLFSSQIDLALLKVCILRKNEVKNQYSLFFKKLKKNLNLANQFFKEPLEKQRMTFAYLLKCSLGVQCSFNQIDSLILNLF